MLIKDTKFSKIKKLNETYVTLETKAIGKSDLVSLEDFTVSLDLFHRNIKK